MKLSFPTSSDVLAPRSIDDINPDELASLLYEYFSSPADYAEEVLTGGRDEETGELLKTTHFVKRSIPLISEFARICRLTQRELKMLAKLHPNVARAMEFAVDIQEEYLIRRSLEGDYPVQATQWVALNLTKLNNRPTASDQSTESLSEILDSIEDDNRSLLTDRTSKKSKLIPSAQRSEDEQEEADTPQSTESDHPDYDKPIDLSVDHEVLEAGNSGEEIKTLI